MQLSAYEMTRPSLFGVVVDGPRRPQRRANGGFDALSAGPKRPRDQNNHSARSSASARATSQGAGCTG